MRGVERATNHVLMKAPSSFHPFARSLLTEREGEGERALPRGTRHWREREREGERERRREEGSERERERAELAS